MITIAAVKKAIQDGNLKVVREYFEKIEQAEAPAPQYLYKIKAEFLFESVCTNNLEIARYLRGLEASSIELVMRFDKKSEKFVATKSALHLAAELNNVSMLHLLLGTESGESNPQAEDFQYLLNREDSEGNTPLHYACRSAAFSAAKLLIELGSNPEIENFKNHSAASMAPNFWEISKIFQKKIKSNVQLGDLSALDQLRLTQTQINYALNVAYNNWFLYKYNTEHIIIALSRKVKNPNFRSLGYPYGYSLLDIAIKTRNQDLFSEQLKRAKLLDYEDYIISIRNLYLTACKEHNFRALVLLLETEPLRNLKCINEDNLVIDMLRSTCLWTPSSKMTREILSRIELSMQEIQKLSDIEKSLRNSIESYGKINSKETLTENENILYILNEYKEKAVIKKVAYGILAVGSSALVAKWSYNRYCSEKNSSSNTGPSASQSESSNSGSNYRKEPFLQSKYCRTQPTIFSNGTAAKEQKATFHSHGGVFSLSKPKGIGTRPVFSNSSCSMPLFGFGNHFAFHNTLHNNGMGFKYGARIQLKNTRYLSKLFLRR